MGEKIVYKDNKGGENKDISDRGEFDKGKRSITILSTQVGGTSSWTCMVHLNVHFIWFAFMAQVLNFNIHAWVVYASCRFEWWNENQACIGYLVISFPSISKWYQANHGAKDGIMVHSDWYHASKGPFFIP